jgi:hypothetical protein
MSTPCARLLRSTAWSTKVNPGALYPRGSYSGLMPSRRSFVARIFGLPLLGRLFLGPISPGLFPLCTASTNATYLRVLGPDQSRWSTSLRSETKRWPLRELFLVASLPCLPPCALPSPSPRPSQQHELRVSGPGHLSFHRIGPRRLPCCRAPLASDTRSLFTGLFTPLFALPHPTAPIFDDEEWLWESGASFLLTHCSPHHSGPRHQPPTWLWLCDLCRRQGRCRCCQRSPQLGEKSLCSVYIAVLWVFGRSSLFLLTCASVCLPTTCSFLLFCLMRSAEHAFCKCFVGL